MNEIHSKIHALGIVPVLEIEQAENAIPAAEALSRGGLPLVEITFRTEAALDSMRRIARTLPEVLMGAGTVTTLEQARSAVDAGAAFLVSPGLSEAVLQWCLKHEVTMFPGVVTPSEVMLALSLGVEVVKFFPSEAMGGMKTIKAISDPFPKLRLVPTGGIGQDQLETYLRSERILAVGGSWMAKRNLITDGRYDEIAQLTMSATRLVADIRSHVQPGEKK